MSMRIVSYGGGVQSTSLLVLAARGVIDFQTFLFCNVGEDSELPETLDYVHDIAMPYAARHGLAMHELRKTMRDGRTETLYENLHRGTRSITIPMKMPGRLGYMRRTCTKDFKILVIDKWLRTHGVKKGEPAENAIGISTDEIHRARRGRATDWQTTVYPLLTLRMSRDDCAALIRDEGLPMPPKSSCWFCPFHRNEQWQALRDKQPERFAKAVALETMLSDRMMTLQGQPLFFHNRLKPLPMATSVEEQPSLFDDSPLAFCESGFCMT